jgi:hypothetical protein
MRIASLAPAVAVAAAIALGCTTDGAVAPDALTISASSADRDASRGVVADIASRVIAASDRLAANAELTDAITAVNRAIETVNAKGLERSLTRANRALDQLRKSDTEDSAELDAIALALADATRLLSPPPGK